MLKVSNTSVMNFENAMRGARNPMDSWARSDSRTEADGRFVFGPNDLDLARRLCRSGSDHRKFIRQILVCADFTAPLYWWKEYDTYKVATVANSTSTMHKLHAYPSRAEQFSCEKLSSAGRERFESLLAYLEQLRVRFNETKNKALWYEIVQLLPESFNQLRTCTLNYETLVNIYTSRRNHKLDEWHAFCAWIETLPYAKELIVDTALGADAPQ